MVDGNVKAKFLCKYMTVKNSFIGNRLEWKYLSRIDFERNHSASSDFSS